MSRAAEIDSTYLLGQAQVTGDMESPQAPSAGTKRYPVWGSQAQPHEILTRHGV